MPCLAQRAATTAVQVAIPTKAGGAYETSSTLSVGRVRERMETPYLGPGGRPRVALVRLLCRSRMGPLSPDAVTIAVVVRDRYSTFRGCLAALQANTTIPCRVLVVVGGADEVTLAELRAREAHENFGLVAQTKPLSQAESRRLALREVDTRFLVILENDTFVHRNWLGPMLECARQEGAAAVTPLVMWYRGVHAAGCSIELSPGVGDERLLRHSIGYTGTTRMPTDYAETHCVLLDLDRLGRRDIFDDVEPFDVDVGLTLRSMGCRAFVEPRSVVTYAAPPPWELRDVPMTLFRWDPASWDARHRRFIDKWGVSYDASAKRASYRRQHARLTLLRRRPNPLTLVVTNEISHVWNSVARVATKRRRQRAFG